MDRVSTLSVSLMCLLQLCLSAAALLCLTLSLGGQLAVVRTTPESQWVHRPIYNHAHTRAHTPSPSTVTHGYNLPPSHRLIAIGPLGTCSGGGVEGRHGGALGFVVVEIPQHYRFMLMHSLGVRTNMLSLVFLFILSLFIQAGELHRLL